MRRQAMPSARRMLGPRGRPSARRTPQHGAACRQRLRLLPSHTAGNKDAAAPLAISENGGRLSTCMTVAAARPQVIRRIRWTPRLSDRPCQHMLQPRRAGRYRRRHPTCATNKEAAGEPAAQSTGRHHNVREDIGLAGCRKLMGSGDIALKASPVYQHPVNSRLTATHFLPSGTDRSMSLRSETAGWSRRLDGGLRKLLAARHP